MIDSPTSDPPTPNRERFAPLAGLLAVLVPGLGHVYLRELWRGVGVAVGVLGLFFGGILIGGIDVVDSKEDRIWFFGQALVGPVAFAVDRYHQSRFKAYEVGQRQRRRTGNPGELRERNPQGVWIWKQSPGAMPPNSKSLGHANEIGTLAATLAGMLNLIAILDALFHRQTRVEIPPPKEPD